MDLWQGMGSYGVPSSNRVTCCNESPHSLHPRREVLRWPAGSPQWQTGNVAIYTRQSSGMDGPWWAMMGHDGPWWAMMGHCAPQVTMDRLLVAAPPPQVWQMQRGVDDALHLRFSHCWGPKRKLSKIRWKIPDRMPSSSLVTSNDLSNCVSQTSSEALKRLRISILTDPASLQLVKPLQSPKRQSTGQRWSLQTSCAGQQSPKDIGGGAEDLTQIDVITL